MTRFVPWLRRLGTAAGVTAAIVAMGWLCAWLLAPRLVTQPPTRTPAELAEVAAMRAPMDPASAPVPILAGATIAGMRDPPGLAGLVAQGRLPALAERIGPEPAVVATVDGNGEHGGELTLLNVTPVSIMRYGPATLLRWSPYGRPLVPWLATAWSMSPDARTFTFTLRRGVRWSDGAPLTTEDVRYWAEDELGWTALNKLAPILMVRGERATVEIVDTHTFRVVFAHPNATFLDHCATSRGMDFLGSPAHILRRYHPRYGDPAFIAREQRARGQARPEDLYRLVARAENPELPRLTPWVYRHHQSAPPYTFVRNPYFFAVDPAGRQLPYADRVIGIEVNRDLVAGRVIGGGIDVASLMGKHASLLLEARRGAGYSVRRWLRADRSDALISVNLNRQVDPAEPGSAERARMLQTAAFRQALSLAIDRREIIAAIYADETEPAQASPGPQSPFSHPRSLTAFTEHDPVRAGALLDACGMTGRDGDGMRTWPDGSRATLFLECPSWFDPRIAAFLCSHWQEVGVRVVPRTRENSLFYSEKGALLHDLTVWTSNNDVLPTLDPRAYVPVSTESNTALGWARWYQAGGLHGHPAAAALPAPPPDHPMRRAYALWEELKATPGDQAQRTLMHRILDIAAEQVWTIGICTSPDFAVAVRDDVRGVPPRLVEGWDYLSPGNAWPEQWSKRSPPPPDARLAAEATTTTPEPGTPAAAAAAVPASWGGVVLAWMLGLIALAFVALLCLRHPFVLRRLVILVPTLLAISVVVFALIEAPPGDFATARIMELQAEGSQLGEAEVATLRAQYHLDEPAVARYARWMGLPWFLSFDAKDAGLLQGHLGRSMADGISVNQKLGDRILLTVLLSVGSILLTWAIAIPVGIYSAVRPYTLGDYTLSVLTFLGMCIPQFLLALILMQVGSSWFGISLSGLFSPQYAAAPEWSWGKVADLLLHLWAPVLILTVTGTAGLIRMMRANLLDELRRPYVTTARAKGLRPLRLLIKYPLRVALNPFVSGIGHVFPALVSGGAILSIVLTLPTVGPEQVKAMLNKDTAYAASVLMVLATLGVLGTLVSDLLLLWLDPRIRLEER